MNITWITKTIRHVDRSFKGVRMQGVGVKVFRKKAYRTKGEMGRVDAFLSSKKCSHRNMQYLSCLLVTA